eukprot:COSAG01_NODE_1806_length_9192_cov_11.433410_7_plen_100_part_00
MRTAFDVTQAHNACFAHRPPPQVVDLSPQPASEQQAPRAAGRQLLEGSAFAEEKGESWWRERTVRVCKQIAYTGAHRRRLRPPGCGGAGGASRRLRAVT